MIFKHRRGAMAIFFCLLITATLLILNICLQAARMRSNECDLQRAMSAQIQTTLAGFDQEWRQFGLFGFLPTAADPAVFKESLPDHLKNCQVNLDFGKPVTDIAILDQQIIRYMKGRVPAVYLNLLVEKMALYKQTINSQSRSATSITSLLDTAFGDFKNGEIEAASTGLFGDILDQLKNEALTKMKESYRHYAAQIFGVSSNDAFSDIIGDMPDFLEPRSISGLAAHLDNLLNFKTAPIYEKCCLVEYILGQFRPAVQQMYRKTGIQPLQTLDGRSFETFPDDRVAEVEQILTGLQKPDSAKLAVRMMITSFRSLIHLAAIMTDQAQMAALRANALAISTSVAVLSAGTIVISPDVVAYLLAAGEAIGKGLSDYQKMADGRPVDLWPGKTKLNLPFYYQDHIRIFLFAVPRSLLLQQIEARLSAILPTPCYTQLQVSAIYHNKTYRLDGAYQSN